MMPLFRCVLLVDDDPTVRFLNRRLLEQLDVAEHILEAGNGQLALAAVRAQCRDDFRTCPDLLLVDVRMPVMDGLEFLEAYYALPREMQCARAVVLLTTSLNPRDVQRAARLPLAGYWPKPLAAERLLSLPPAPAAAPPIA